MQSKPSDSQPSLRRKPRKALQLILHPLRRFLQTEASSGIVLLTCTAVALLVANSAWAAPFHAFWHDTHLVVGVGRFVLDRSLEWWINDGLMTLFFFVVGLEIKRELVTGELRDPRKAALPAAAALGGMIVPALIYWSLQPPGESQRGWGIPMATDIAFVVGVLALLGPRVPPGLKIMLLSLAIVDDLGAVLVIAIFYSTNISTVALGWALAGLAGILGLRALGVRSILAYVPFGVVIWLATYHSGVHPTIAGVILGLLTPARVKVGKARLLQVMALVRTRLEVDSDSDDLDGLGDEVQALMEYSQETSTPVDRLLASLHPWVAFVIMPLFGLVNAGVAINPALIGHPVAISVALGLVLGKPIGIFLFSWLAVQVGIARLPQRVSYPVVLGAGCLGGIGFTMSLFITSLAFTDVLLSIGKVGTLTGSLTSAIIGSTLLLLVLPPSSTESGESNQPTNGTPAVS
ncbi:MAG: Na+/H+ antiporter NhaA [Gemmataceae bacterium]